MKRFRIKWSEFEYNHALKIRIPDWSLVKTMCHNLYLLVDAVMDYKDREIELCVPYNPFITAIRMLPHDEQVLIKEGKAVITLMKTYKKIEHGIVIKEVAEWEKN